MRFATVRNARDAKQLWAYLPSNYVIVGSDIGQPNAPVYVIAGVDDAGWTLDDYIIPRLASGLIWAEEVAPELVADIRRDLERGREFSSPGTMTAAAGEVLATGVLARMMHRVLVDNVEAEKAVEDAHKKAVEIYARWPEG